METRFHNPKLIERCRRFWCREAVDRPLVGVLVDRSFPLQTFPVSDASAEVRPADVTAQWFRSECDRRHQASEETGGDVIFVAYAGIGIPWIEAVLGCAVKIQSGTGWAERLGADWETYSRSSVQWDNGWLDKMQELTRIAVSLGEGRHPVGPAHLRSPIDLAWSLLGAETLSLSMYDHPQELRDLLDVLCDVWVKMVEAQYDVLPAYHGGYYNGNQPIWAPGRTMFVTADVASILSPRTFKQFVAPSLRRIVTGLPYCIMHTHSTYLHALETVLDIEELRAIQVGIDDTDQSDPITPHLPAFRRIQERKALIVAITEQDPAAAAAQARAVMEDLSPNGLCILAYLPTALAGSVFLARLQRDQQYP